jgi:hypothetical protein
MKSGFLDNWSSASGAIRAGGIRVRCIGIDDKGRVKLSRKAALKERAAAETGQTTEPDRIEEPPR